MTCAVHITPQTTYHPMKMLSILTTGRWSASQVSVEWTANSRQRMPEVEAIIEQAWQGAITHKGLRLFDGKMCRTEGWKATGADLHFRLSHTSYKTFFGTNLTHPDLAVTHGQDVMANPVGLSAALVTADDRLVFGRRNAAVAYYPNRIHPFAGAFEPRDGLDLFSAMTRELTEEARLSADDLTSISCIGIVEDHALLQPELIFDIRTTKTLAELEQQVDASEHTAIWSIPATEQAVRDATKDPRLTPVGAATLVVWGRQRYGESFLKQRFGAATLPAGTL